MKPTSRAATTVPSRTPARPPASTTDRTAASTVMDTSKAIFDAPNSRFQVVQTARTKDSPGSMATLGSTSR